MGELVQVNFRAGADQKARWMAYVEESGRFASLSELIRASVEAEIKDDQAEESSPAPALANDLNEMQEELTAVRKNVAWLREHFQEDVDISAFAQAVFDALEELPEVTEPIQVPEDEDMDADAYHQQLPAEAVVDPDETGQYSPQTARALADRLDATPDRVRDAIEYLDEQFLPVTAIEYNGERHYFQEA